MVEDGMKPRRNYFTVQRWFEDAKRWDPELLATAVNSGYAKGYLAAMKCFYPISPCRIVNFHTQEVVEEFKGHGKVGPCDGK